MTTALEHALQGMIHVENCLTVEHFSIYEYGDSKEKTVSSKEYTKHRRRRDTLSSWKGYLLEHGIDKFYHRMRSLYHGGAPTAKQLAAELYAYMWLEPSVSAADFKAAAGYMTDVKAGSALNLVEVAEVSVL